MLFETYEVPQVPVPQHSAQKFWALGDKQLPEGTVVWTPALPGDHTYVTTTDSQGRQQNAARRRHA